MEGIIFIRPPVVESGHVAADRVVVKAKAELNVLYRKFSVDHEQYGGLNEAPAVEALFFLNLP